jgi:threonine aldolase
MRAAMAAAEVGDDVMGEDPTVNALQDYAVTLSGKEAALFVTSGTQANLLAFLSQTSPGDTVILSADAHPYRYESGNLAMIGGLMTALIHGEYGKFNAAQLDKSIVQNTDHHSSNTTLASIENTTNRGGGAFYTPDEVEEIAGIAHGRGLQLHCDGARIFNAAIAADVPVSALARHCDTLSFCLSKGLGAPVGSILTGTAETIDRAHRFRKMLGGGMRQAGVIAAAGIHALQHHVEPLRDDHRRAQRFRETLEEAGIRFCLPSPTNILFVEVTDAPAIQILLKERGVLVFAVGDSSLRIVFNRDVSDEDLEEAITAFKKILAH